MQRGQRGYGASGAAGGIVLDDVPRWFVGRVTESLDSGDHVAFMLEPVAGEVGDWIGQLGFQSGTIEGLQAMGGLTVMTAGAYFVTQGVLTPGQLPIATMLAFTCFSPVADVMMPLAVRTRDSVAWRTSVRPARVRHLLGWWEGRQSWPGSGCLRKAPPAMSSLRGTSLWPSVFGRVAPGREPQGSSFERPALYHVLRTPA